MKLTVVGRQMNVFDETKEQIAKKLQKLDKYFADEEEATVTLSRKHGSSRMEITITANGTLFRSEQDSDDFRTSLDRCVDAIERQIRRNKTRLAKRLRTALPPEEEFFAKEDEDPEFILRRKTFPVKPMTAEEAILQMNLLGHNFFLFANADDPERRICAVYVRNDGDYGILEPET